MNTSQLSKYAPEARRAFIAAVTARAASIGLRPEGTEPIVEEGDVALIGGQPFPRSIAEKRRRLEERIARTSFDQAMEAIAYTWFNRLVAIRYMELHGYLDHGYRVLSHPEARGRPEILDHAADVDLPGLDRDKAVELKLDGTKDEDLYRLLLLAQCNALHQAMPFLFEKIGDETELLLPANLLHTDSLIRQLVERVDEALWQEIEIIGWLYQFYISEKKDEVIGKVVASIDIPAATQLFTPNWIVKYMVQNSLGAQWLATYPTSPLKGQMDYYIEPAEQTDEVKAQLAAITPSELNPEELTLIDPASGSGHILVEAYELFKAIYLERGYRRQDIPQLILEKNLYGLEICPRAAQLTGFSLMMKGREDDRQLFERGVKLNVMALADSAVLDAEKLAEGIQLAGYGLDSGDLSDLKQLFQHATTFGSLIQVPEGLAEKLAALKKLSEVTSQDLFVAEVLKRLGLLVQQAELLAAQYDAVVANPPYMGSKGMNVLMKKFAKDHFPKSRSDLFSVSTERFREFAVPEGFLALMTPFTWMFLKSYEWLRQLVLEVMTLRSLIQPQYHTMFHSAAVPICTFVIQNSPVPGYEASFIKLTDFYGADRQAGKTLEAINNPDCGWFYRAKPRDFRKIPGSPVAYWTSEAMRNVFSDGISLDRFASIGKGLDTGDNDRFLRRWHEVPRQSDWVPCLKGGPYRKWYGNQEYVVYWKDNGAALRNFAGSNLRNAQNYLRPGITWTRISSSSTAFRVFTDGFIFESTGPSIFSDRIDRRALVAYLNSSLSRAYLRCLAPTMDFQSGHISAIPVVTSTMRERATQETADSCIAVSRRDWDNYERSWDFQSLPILTASSDPTPTLESSYEAWITQNRDTITKMKRLEEENNRLFIGAYGLGEELTPDVPVEQITLTVNPAYRYGGKLTEEEQWDRFRQDTCEELSSYAIGCMMGRYSLDEPGLIYANSGNEGFDPSRYSTFPADDDGIIPITDYPWFDDDAAHRFERFLAAAWPKENLEANLKFVADNLKPKKGEQPRDTIRRYLANGFFKQHLSTYKKRPIYWLFTSGKQKVFQCLVYLHRYNEGTLARMRTEYVIPLQGKIASRIDQLDGDIAAATSTPHRKKLEKERDSLVKQRTELQEFDENLRHYADQRIALDLDDGVKVNYGKFGDMLAEVKTVTGKPPAK